MDSKKEKTSTKTIELKNVQEKLASIDKTGERKRDLDDVTDPTLKANREASEKAEVTRKVLLSDSLKKVDDDDEDSGDIEFSASTQVFELDSSMKKALGGQAHSADSTVALKIPTGLSEEEAKKIKLQVKSHYIKKAQVLEAEINKILQGFKTSNPALLAQIDKIRVLLGKHSGRIKD